jgi:hypothetical protein
VKFRKQNFLDEAEEPESEPIEREREDLNFIEGYLVTGVGISLSADTGSNEWRATETGQRNVRLLAFLS